MIRALALFLVLAAALPAAAHDLRVFASVSGDTVNVEAKFSNDRLPRLGEVRVYDAAEILLLTLPLEEDGVTSFPLPAGTRETGLMIVVAVDEGHEDYWLLTPDDIAQGAGQKQE